MKFDIDVAYLGKMKLTIIYSKTKLWVSNAVISSLTFESGITRVFACLNSSEKGFEGKFYPKSDILENMGIDFLDFRHLKFHLRQSILSLKAFYCSLFFLPGILPIMLKYHYRPACKAQVVYQGHVLELWLEKVYSDTI